MSRRWLPKTTPGPWAGAEWWMLFEEWDRGGGDLEVVLPGVRRWRQRGLRIFAWHPLDCVY